MKLAVTLLVASLGTFASARMPVLAPASVAYPEGYRTWAHVKSTLISPAHANFASTGGWGFQRFVKDSKTELAATPTPQQCFACHDKLKKDGLVLSTYRQ